MQLENEILQLNTRAKGGELTKVYHKPSQSELLWNGNSEIWGWHAPNLFPVVGACFNNQILVDGKKYPMDRHGFLRNQTCELAKKTDTSVTWMLASNDELLLKYPFNFEIYTTYTLVDQSIIVSFEVKNIGNMRMYFSIGAHPAFVLPGEGNYGLEFQKTEKSNRHLVNDKGLFNGLTKSVDFKNNFLILEPTLFQDDAIVFKDLVSREVTLIRPKSPVKIKLHFAGFTDFGIWTKPGKVHFICLEPWLGYADHANGPIPFNQKEGILSLEPKQTFKISYNIEVV